MKQRQPNAPVGLEWTIMSIALGVGHFVLFFILAFVFAGRAPWVLHPFALLLVVAEKLLPHVTSYSGDLLQWPLIVCNSLIYGTATWWFVRRFRSRVAA